MYGPIIARMVRGVLSIAANVTVSKQNSFSGTEGEREREMKRERERGRERERETERVREKLVSFQCYT